MKDYILMERKDLQGDYTSRLLLVEKKRFSNSGNSSYFVSGELDGIHDSEFRPNIAEVSGKWGKINEYLSVVMSDSLRKNNGSGSEELKRGLESLCDQVPTLNKETVLNSKEIVAMLSDFETVSGNIHMVRFHSYKGLAKSYALFTSNGEDEIELEKSSLKINGLKIPDFYHPMDLLDKSTEKLYEKGELKLAKVGRFNLRRVSLKPFEKGNEKARIRDSGPWLVKR